MAFFVFRDRSDDAFGTISDNRYLFFHHHRSTPRNRRTPTFFFFSLKTRSIQKRKEEKRSVRAQKEKGGLCLPRSFRRRRRNDLSERTKSALFFIIARLRERAFFSRRPPPRETKNETHTKRKEKTRTPKNTPPFLKMSQHVATKKRWKNFSSALPLFTLKPETGVSRTSLFAVLPLAPKRLTLLPSLVSWSERGKRHAELFLNEAFFLPFLV